MLRATTACNFWTSQLPKVLRIESAVLFTFWLGNVLRATTACTFWTSQRPKMLRTWGACSVLASKCASRHSGVQFLIYLFVRFDSFSSLTFFLFLSLLWLFPPLLLHLSILSKVWLLNFLRWMVIWMVGSGFRIGGSSKYSKIRFCTWGNITCIATGDVVHDGPWDRHHQPRLGKFHTLLHSFLARACERASENPSSSPYSSSFIIIFAIIIITTMKGLAFWLRLKGE